MRVATFLSAGQATQLREALNAHDELCAATSWDDLEHLVTAEPLSVVVFNPAADGKLNAAHACHLIRKYPSTAFIAYVPLDAGYMRGVALMSSQGLQDVVVTQSSDSPRHLRRILNSASAIQDVAELVRQLEPTLHRLPPSLEQVLIDALSHPHRYASTEDIASSACITMSAVYRSFRRVGLRPPKNFLVGARVFRGFLYLRDASESVRHVATRLGYAHPRIFARQIECVLGGPPSVLRQVLSAEQCLVLAVNWLTGSVDFCDMKTTCADREETFTHPAHSTRVVV